MGGGEREVVESCGRDSGEWYCATHGLWFRNNMNKDGHTGSKGDHLFVWWCHDHGPEAP